MVPFPHRPFWAILSVQPHSQAAALLRNPKRTVDYLMALRPLHAVRNCLCGVTRDTDLDLTVKQMAVFLVMAQDEGPHTVRHLAITTGIDKALLSRVWDRLEGMGLIVRADDPRDRRSVIASLTVEGRLTYQKLEVFAAGDSSGRRASGLSGPSAAS
jgi:DNA-binding MarR family transcriptional regulator